MNIVAKLQITVLLLLFGCICYSDWKGNLTEFEFLGLVILLLIAITTIEIKEKKDEQDKN